MSKKVILTETELVELVKKILLEQKLDFKIEQEGSYIKINNFTFQLQAKLPFGSFQPIKVLDLKPKNDMTGYKIEVVDPREINKSMKLEIDNDTINKKILPNLRNTEILIPGLVADKKLVKIK